VQAIASADVGFALARHALDALPARQQQEAIDSIIAEEASISFDLAKGPLIRGRLLRLSEREHVLLITQHHIVSDGWSVGVLIREFSQLYTAYCQGQQDPLPALSIQYADYASWQRAQAQAESVQGDIAFWKQQLS